MGRVTRKKAAEIAEQLHVDEDAVLDMNADDAALRTKLETPEHSGRSPLGEIAPNSAESKAGEHQEPVEELKKSTRSRKAGKKAAAKGKKNALAASTATPVDEANLVPDDCESAPSPGSEKAAEGLVNPQSARKLKIVVRPLQCCCDADADRRLISVCKRGDTARSIAESTECRSHIDQEPTRQG